MSPRKSRRIAAGASTTTATTTHQHEENHHQPSTAHHHSHAPPAPPTQPSLPPPTTAHTLTISHTTAQGALPAPSPPDRPTSQTSSTAQAAVEAGDEPAAATAATAANKQKSSWNALSRYYSEATSFPDYGLPPPAMGAEKLRQINQATGPVNTLTGSGNKRDFSDSVPVSHQAFPKRPRLRSPRRDGLSPKAGRSRSSAWKSASRRLSGEAVVDQAASDSRFNSMQQRSDKAKQNLSPLPAARGTSHARRPSEPAASPVQVRASPSRAPSARDEIETSDDELQANTSTPPGPARRTNFSHISPSPRSRLRMRGDINTTSFDKAPANHRARGSSVEMEIVKAISGRNTYDLGDSKQPRVALRRSPSHPFHLEAWTDGHPDGAYAWISFDAQDVTPNSLRFGARYLKLRRSMSMTRSPDLFLTFANPEDASEVAQLIQPRIHQNSTRDEMERILANLWNKALDDPRPPQKESSARAPIAPRRGMLEEAATIRGMSDSPERKSARLRDGMTTRQDPARERIRSSSPHRRKGTETRRTRRRSPISTDLPVEFDRWSEKNTSWQEDWKQTLVYPAKGRNRASVDKEDILRLDEGEFLNDNLISFYLRYLQAILEQQTPELLKRVHIFSTFFFEKLVSRKGGINYDGVKNWTAKIDLFSYDYIIVPVNERAHWYLAVICNTPKLLDTAESITRPSTPSTDALGRPIVSTPVMRTVEREMSDISLEDMSGLRRSSRQTPNNATPPSSKSQTADVSAMPSPGPRLPSRRLDASQPRIVTLDSLGSNHPATCKALRDYLVEEAKDKKGITLTTVPGGMKARGIPEQTNFCDCGVFVLGYMEEFLKDPDGLISKILMREDVSWSIYAAKLRRQIRDLLFRLQGEQNVRMAAERKERRHQKRLGKSSISSVSEIQAQSPRQVLEKARIPVHLSPGRPPSPAKAKTLAGNTAAEDTVAGKTVADKADNTVADNAVVDNAVVDNAVVDNTVAENTVAENTAAAPAIIKQSLEDDVESYTDEDVVSMVKMRPESSPERRNSRENTPLPRVSRGGVSAYLADGKPTERSNNSAEGESIEPLDKLPSSTTATAQMAENDTQESVQLVSVVAKTPTTPKPQPRAARDNS